MFKYILFIPLLIISCTIGNFSDINRGEERLFLYAGTAFNYDILVFEVDQKSDTLNQKSAYYTGGTINKIIFDYENKRLFAASSYDIYGFDIMDNGNLELLPGYPITHSNIITDIVFTHNYNFLMAVTDVNTDLYGYKYSRDAGTMTPLVAGGIIGTLPESPSVLQSINSNDGFMFYSSTAAGWYMTGIDDFGNYTGSVLMTNLAGNIYASTLAYNKYLVRYRSNASPPPYINTHVQLFAADTGEIGPIQTFGDNSPGGFNYSVFGEYHGKLYYSHNAETGIYTLAIDQSGNVESNPAYNPASYSDITVIADDPAGEYLMLASVAGMPSMLGLMKLNESGYPDSGVFSTSSINDVIVKLEFFRYEN